MRWRGAARSRKLPPYRIAEPPKERIMGCRSRYIDDPSMSEVERGARRQIARLRGFYHHLLVFALVNTGLLAINLVASPGRLWFYWPLLGWGIWLALHAVGTFGSGRWLGVEWEERKLRQLLADKAVK